MDHMGGVNYRPGMPARERLALSSVTSVPCSTATKAGSGQPRLLLISLVHYLTPTQAYMRLVLERSRDRSL